MPEKVLEVILNKKALKNLRAFSANERINPSCLATLNLSLAINHYHYKSSNRLFISSNRNQFW